MAYVSRLSIVVDSRTGEQNLRRLQSELGQTERRGTQAFGNLKNVAMAFSGALAAIGVSEFTRNTFAAIESAQKLQASLKTVTGSVSAANAAWSQMVEFAKETPFSLEQSVTAFIRMKSLGIDPTEEALRSFGNTASAMGKDMMQMVEAVADATTGEFERLKEFGIKASQEGDRVSLTFQGVTKIIRNNAESIKDYLEEIGRVEFAGAMADQMDTLGGKASNLGDNIDQLYRQIGEAGATQLFSDGLDAASSAVEGLTENLDTVITGMEILVVLAGGRLAAAIATSTKSMVAQTLATNSSIKAEAAAAMAVTRRTGAELQSAKAILSTAQIEARATAGTNAHTFALSQLSVARVRATEAAAAHTAATNAATAAMGRASIAARTLSSAMALVGGPVGIALIAAGSLYYFREELGLVGEQASNTQQRIDALTSSMGTMGEAAIKSSIESVRAEMQFLEDQAWNTQRAINNLGEGETFGGRTKSQLQEQLEFIGRDFDSAKEKLGELEGRLEEFESNKPAKVFSDLADESDKFAKSVSGLLDELYPLQRSQREYSRQKAILIRYAEQEGLSNEWLNESLSRLDDSYKAAAASGEDFGFKGVKAAGDVQKAFDPALKAMERGVERLDDSFVDFWENTLSGAENTFDSFKDLAISTLAEIIHAYTTRKITASLGASLSVDGSSGVMGGQSGGMGDLGDLASLGKNIYSGIVDGFGAVNWFGAPTSYTSGFGSQVMTGGLQSGQGFMNQGFLSNGSTSNFSGMSGLASLGASMLGNYVGSTAGESLTGKQANSNIGSTVLGTAGTFFAGPVGGFLGSAAGSVIDAALGSSPPELDLSLRRRPSEAYADRPNWDEGVRSRSAFGTLGLDEHGTHDINSLWSPEEAQKLFDGLAQLDDALASLAKTPEQLQAMTDAVMAPDRHGMQGHYGETSHASNVVRILTSRYKDAIDVLDLATEDFLLSFEGKAQDLVQVTANLSSFEDMLGDNSAAMADMQSALADSDDIVATTQTLLQQAQAMSVLSDSASQLNLTFDSTVSGALDASQSLADLVGGVSNLTSLNSRFFDAFYSDSEKFDRLSSSLSEAFDEMGRDLPTTREGVRSLVEGLDLMTESGREQYAQIMQLVPSLQQYTGTLAEQQQAAEQAAEAISNERWGLQNELLKAQGRDTELLNRQRERELAGLDESNRALQKRIWALQDEEKAQEAAAQAAQEAQEAAAQAAQEAARRASMISGANIYGSGLIGNASDALGSFNDASSTLDDIARTRQAQLDDEYRAIESLSDLIDSLAVSELATGSRLDAARQQYNELYQQAMGGDAEAAQQLGDAAQTYLDLQKQSSSTAQEYARVYGQVTNGVVGLQGQFEESVDQLDDVARYNDRQLREQERTNHTLLDSLTQLVDSNSSLQSIADLIDILPSDLASRLSDIFPEYGSDVGQSAFNEAAYLANKTAQVNANNQGGRSDWTVGEVYDRIMQDFGSVYAHYQQYGRDEGVLPGFGGSSDSGSPAPGSADSANQFNESKYLGNYLDYLNQRDAGEREWSRMDMLDAFSDANLTPYEHWMRYGRSEGVKAYATGAWKLDSDQLAYVHKDEMVVPSRNGIADEFRAYASGNSYGELLKEVKQLRLDLAASQRAIAENTRKSARVLERYDLRQRQEEFA